MAELRFIDDARADRADEWWPEDKAKANVPNWEELYRYFRLNYYTTEQSNQTPQEISALLQVDVQELLEANSNIKRISASAKLLKGTTLKRPPNNGHNTEEEGGEEGKRFEASSPVPDVQAFVDAAAASAALKTSAQAEAPALQNQKPASAAKRKEPPQHAPKRKVSRLKLQRKQPAVAAQSAAVVQPVIRSAQPAVQTAAVCVEAPLPVAGSCVGRIDRRTREGEFQLEVSVKNGALRVTWE
eukprot:COSAG01_NODE_20532_length_949_cov_0.845882_1_plen_242_part_01